MTVQSSNLVLGRNTKWYIGGVYAIETHTVTSGEVSAGYFDLANTAEYGLIRATVDGTETAMTHYQASSTTPATQTSGTGAVTYSGIAENDVVILHYINVDTTAMSQGATSQGGTITDSSDETSATVDGQTTKIYAIGAADSTVTWKELVYNNKFRAAMYGSELTNDVASGKSTWSNAFTGFNSVGALVGIQYASDNTTILRKFGLIGLTPMSVATDFTTDSYYSDSLSAKCDIRIDFDNQ